MMSQEFFNREQKTEELVRKINELMLKNARPAEEVILDDEDFCKLLKISKRQAAQLRAERLITYSKPGGKVYYRLSDILDYIKKNIVPSIDTLSRF